MMLNTLSMQPPQTSQAGGPRSRPPVESVAEATFQRDLEQAQTRSPHEDRQVKDAEAPAQKDSRSRSQGAPPKEDGDRTHASDGGDPSSRQADRQSADAGPTGGTRAKTADTSEQPIEAPPDEIPLAPPLVALEAVPFEVTEGAFEPLMQGQTPQATASPAFLTGIVLPPDAGPHPPQSPTALNDADAQVLRAIEPFLDTGAGGRATSDGSGEQPSFFSPDVPVETASTATPDASEPAPSPGAFGPPSAVVPPATAAPTVAVTNAAPVEQSAPQTPLPQTQTPIEEANVARVVRGIRSAVNQRGGSITLRLHPPELGFVRIQMQLQDGAVRAQIESSHPNVRALLDQQLGQLRSALESQGLTVERLVTQTLPAGQASDASSQQDQDPAADGRSRGAFEQGRQENTDQDAGDTESPDSDFDQLLNTLA